MTGTDYQSICKSNAERFLKTAFLLDDKVVFEVTAATETDTKLTKLPLVPLKGTTLTKSFLEKGISCSILKPSEEEKGSESLESYIIDVIQNVDLPILDWSIHGDDGEWVIAILRRLIEEYHYPEGRVALILIYTELNVEQVYDKVRESLRDIFNGSESRSEDSYLLTIGGLRILFAQRDEAMDEEQLPEYLTKEFSKMHRGILENGVMQAISEIREKTYNILSRFPAILDAPFLAHQSALNRPDDGGVHAVELITSEIVSLLMQAGLPGEIISEEAVEALLVNADNGILTKTRDIKVRAEEREKIREIITSGAYEKSIELILGKKEILAFGNNKSNAITRLTNILSGANDIEDPMGIENNARLAQLFSLQGHYPEYTPILSLGTIVQSAGNYLICILPYCDSERIEADRNFPFLNLKIRDPRKGGDKICFVVGHDVKVLEPRLFPHELEIHQFPADLESKRVLAKREDSEWKFLDIHGDEYIWVGTLKRECAQRIANDFGAKISRVGLNESEWQQR